MTTHYDVLGLDHEADLADIKKAYRRLAMECHPDKGGDATRFQKIQEAYDCLKDDSLRNQYDMDLHHGTYRSNAGGGYDAPSMFSFTTQAGFEFMADHFADMFRSQMEEKIWNSFASGATSTSKNNSINIPAIEVELPISLFDVCVGGEKMVNFERLAFVDATGNLVKLHQLATDTCSTCHGKGTETKLINNRFFMHQSVHECSKCEGKGYTFINGCKLARRKCRFRHTIPIGILENEVFRFEGDGDLFYDKQTRQFKQGDILIKVRYDLNETNRILSEVYEFPNISIVKTEYGDIHYEYTASIYEYITGTKFNLALPNGRFMLLRVRSLAQTKVIKGFGLPQIINHNTNRTEMRNLVVSFKMKPVNTIPSISESDRIILRRIMAAEYPRTTDEDAILVDYS
jgi:molecular chaperone DnaJ